MRKKQNQIFKSPDVFTGSKENCIILRAGFTHGRTLSILESCLKSMGECVKRNGGLCQEYHSRGLTAVFPDNPEDGVNCAIELLAEKSEWKDLFIGIHLGPVQAEVLDFDDRKTVMNIGEGWHESLRIQEMAEAMEIPLLCSKNFVNVLPDLSEFLFRLAGALPDESGINPVRVYEFPVTDPVHLVELKMIVREPLEKGIEAYFSGDYLKALDIFRNIFGKNEMDLVARYYLRRCIALLKRARTKSI